MYFRAEKSSSKLGAHATVVFPGEIISFGSCCLADIFINGAMFPDSAIGSREIVFFCLFIVFCRSGMHLTSCIFGALGEREKLLPPFPPPSPREIPDQKGLFFAPYKTPFIPFVTAGAGGEGSRVAKRRRRRRALR